MLEAIDLNRGVHIFTTAAGVRVYVYVGYAPNYEGADPCSYYSVHGNPVSEELARQANVPVDLLKKKCVLKTRISEASERIRQELEAENAAGTSNVIEERGGFKVIDIGLGRARVVDEDEQPLHTEMLTKEQALNLLKDLTPETK